MDRKSRICRAEYCCAAIKMLITCVQLRHVCLQRSYLHLLRLRTLCGKHNTVGVCWLPGSMRVLRQQGRELSALLLDQCRDNCAAAC
jgi:hypothetical protein